MILSHVVVLALLPFFCDATKRKIDDIQDEAVEVSSGKSLSLTEVTLHILNAHEKMPGYDVAEIMSQYLSTDHYFDAITFAEKVSVLYDALMENGMSEYVAQMFSEFASKGDIWDDESIELFTQTLPLLNFEGWEELLRVTISKRVTNMSVALIKVIPNNAVLRHRIFVAICDANSEKILDNETIFLYLYYLMKNRYPQSLDFEETRSANPSNLDVRYSDLLSMFELFPQDMWSVDELLYSFRKGWIAPFFLQAGMKAIKYLGSVELWDEAISLRLNLIEKLAPLIQARCVESSKQDANTSPDMINDDDGLEYWKKMYEKLVLDLETNSAFFNRALEIIVQGKANKAVPYIIETMPHIINDLMVKIVEEAPKDSELYQIVKESLEKLSLKLDLGHQNGRMVSSALERKTFYAFLSYYYRLIIAVDEHVGYAITKAIQRILQTLDDDVVAIMDILGGMQLSQKYFSEQFKEQLKVIAEENLPVFSIVAMNPKSLINLGSIHHESFPLETVARSAIKTGDEKWCQILSADPVARDVFDTEASLLMSEGYPIPSVVYSYLS